MQFHYFFKEQQTPNLLSGWYQSQAALIIRGIDVSIAFSCFCSDTTNVSKKPLISTIHLPLIKIKPKTEKEREVRIKKNTDCTARQWEESGKKVIQYLLKMTAKSLCCSPRQWQAQRALIPKSPRLQWVQRLRRLPIPPRRARSHYP